MANKKIKEQFWLWGHPLNSCQKYVAEKMEMTVTPAECARYFGLTNIYYVPWGHDMDMKEYGKDQKGIAKTGLSVETWGKRGDDPVEETFKLVPLLKNLNRLVFDDFFIKQENPAYIHTYNRMTVKELIKIRERIHAAGLEIWLVLYQHQLEMPEVPEFVKVFDGVSFWFWSEPTVESYHKYSQMFIDMTPEKRRLIGCYLYNFGKKQSANPELVRYQLDRNKELMKKGLIEGVVLHNNNFGGLNIAAYEEAKKWMDEQN